jgi:hypothetical protein
VVLVLGDVQGSTTSDDVPPAARKALTDMREFLPFKSYKLLDAAWLMCCGEDSRTPSARAYASTTRARGSVSQILRGPDEREYALQLETSRAENSRVFVKFTLTGMRPTEAPTERTDVSTRSLQRRVEDLTDQLAYLRKQHEDAKKKVEIGISPGNEIAKLELDIRRVEREIEDNKARLAEQRAAGRSNNLRSTPTPPARSALIDTSFTMDVGETVVVGTSRLTGGSRALIALLTAVPPRGAVRKE